MPTEKRKRRTKSDVEKKRHPYKNGQRWCQICQAYKPAEEFGAQLTARCHEHWLIWNREKNRKRHAAHPEEDVQRAKRWREQNPKQAQINSRKQAARQKALGYPATKKWQKNNPDKVREGWRKNDKKWRTENPEKHQAAAHRKRVRRQGNNIGQHTGQELRTLQEQFNDTCLYCQKSKEAWDHIIPVSRGGTNFIWNMAPTCKPCNSSKHAQHPLEFLTQCHPTARGVEHIKNALHQHELLGNPARYKRNNYEKIASATLWDALEAVYRTKRKVTLANLDVTQFAASTFYRRIGSLPQINAMLIERCSCKEK